MHIYVVLTEDEHVIGRFDEEYQERYWQIMPCAWVVADEKRQPARVGDRLGIGKKINGRIATGVVYSTNKYYGHFDNGLWQVMQDWREDRV